MRKQQIAFAALLALFSPLLGSAQEKWDLKQCVEYALSNNLSVQQQDVQARLEQLTLEQSRLARYPSLHFTNNTGLNTGRSIDRTTNQFTTQSIFYSGFSLQSSVEVFNFHRQQHTIAANRFAAEAATATVDKVRNDVALNVAGAYLQILLNHQQVEISQVQVQQTAAQLSNTRKQVEAGSVPELNAAQLEAQLAQDSATLITTQGAETQSLLYLKALLSMDAGQPFAIATPPVALIPLEPLASLQPEAVYQQALANLPQQRANRLRLLAAQRSVAAARGAMYPSLSLGANLQTNYSTARNQALALEPLTRTDTIGKVSGSNAPVLTTVRVPQYTYYADPFGTQFSNNFGNGVGLSLSVPIFNGGAARTGWQRAKLNVRTYELQQQQENLTLKQDIYKAYTDAVTSLQKFTATTKGAEAAQKAFEFATKRYDIGLLNSLDLIISQSNLYRARQERLLAQFDYVFKMKVLEFYKGQGIRL
ncbi:TolC family protein [Paraflavisolibacter sp. H34]|uniref:TolC family protein n=1 Tax=Huijunlia imazamoxiresistens TaxID=3127457 RepID=UPI00301990D6